MAPWVPVEIEAGGAPCRCHAILSAGISWSCEVKKLRQACCVPHAVWVHSRVVYIRSTTARRAAHSSRHTVHASFLCDKPRVCELEAQKTRGGYGGVCLFDAACPPTQSQSSPGSDTDKRWRSNKLVLARPDPVPRVSKIPARQAPSALFACGMGRKTLVVVRNMFTKSWLFRR